MALLSGELWFEPGLLDVTVADAGRSGSSEFWTPPRLLNEEMIHQKRKVARRGEPFQLLITPQPAKGVPADPAQAMAIIQGANLSKLHSRVGSIRTSCAI